MSNFDMFLLLLQGVAFLCIIKLSYRIDDVKEMVRIVFEQQIEDHRRAAAAALSPQNEPKPAEGTDANDPL